MTIYMLHVQETDQKFPIPPEIGTDDNLIDAHLLASFHISIAQSWNDPKKII